jgi:hypothetical protein
MSERRRTDEMTDPGPPPEEALDATLRALGAPVPAQTRRTAESAGLDVAHYHAEARRPPRAHEAHEPPSSSRVATTEPMASAVQANVERDTIRMEPREQRLDLTTVPRAAPAPSRMSTFLGALVFVVLVLGVAAWALLRGGSQPDQPATVASSTTTATPASGTAVVFVAPVPAPPTSAPAVSASNDTSSATIDPPRPTGRPQPTSTSATSTAAPRHLSTAATSAASAPSPPPIVTTTPVAPPAPTTKYNRFLEEDKK